MQFFLLTSLDRPMLHLACFRPHHPENTARIYKEANTHMIISICIFVGLLCKEVRSVEHAKFQIDFEIIILFPFPGKVLQATDRRKVTFLDVLIECDQKMVVSNAAVALIVIIMNKV